jgi:hypothetical protein
MLSFILDEHVSPDVAVIVRRSRPEIPVFALLDWQDASGSVNPTKKSFGPPAPKLSRW